MMARGQIASLVLMLSVLVTCAAPPCRADEPGPGWPVVGGTQGGGHFTPLTQITAENVNQLHEEWVYHTGDFSPGAPRHRATTFEATPILANAMLYFCTPYNRVIALQAETGKLVWTHEPDPPLDRGYNKQHSLICRGVSYWQESAPDPTKPCQTRIFQGVLDGRLESLDARTGQRCPDFAAGGTVAPMIIGAPVGMQRGLVLSPLGVPCTRPPWGTISAVDLDTARSAGSTRLERSRPGSSALTRRQVGVRRTWAARW